MTKLCVFSMALALAGCSTSSGPKTVEAPPEPVTGLHALAQMFSAARAWQPDVLVLRETSLSIGDVKNAPGRSLAWQGTFVSQTAQQARTYTFAVSDLSTSVRGGTFADAPVAFNTRGQNAQPFLIVAAKKDSDEVLKTATEHAAEYTAKHPGMAVNFLLEMNNRWPNAAWRVIWGESASDSAYSVLIDASTGEFAKVLN